MCWPYSEFHDHHCQSSHCIVLATDLFSGYKLSCIQTAQLHDHQQSNMWTDLHQNYLHVLHGIASNVVRTSLKVNGNGLKWTPYRSETPSQMKTKLNKIDNVQGYSSMTTIHHNFYIVFISCYSAQQKRLGKFDTVMQGGAICGS
jgi:hypothetical protein